jgi:heme-degrading monooxygenase HmoA
MVIVLIRTALRDDADVAAYEALNARMEELVRAIPGYIDIKSFTANDGDTVSIARFTSADALAAWRNHPEHTEARRLGRERFFKSYAVQVCEVVRAYGSP